jgi:hypothetical protein
MEPNDKYQEIVERLARYLYEAEERLDPGSHEFSWDELGGADRSFYAECIWSLLTRKNLWVRLLQLSDSNLVIGCAIFTKQADANSDPNPVISPGT